MRHAGAFWVVLVVYWMPGQIVALDNSLPFIHADLTQSLMGDGTGVVVGIIDSGMDDTHPALTGLDSLGQNRLVAEANFVTSEPANTGDDVFGHGTAVAGVVMGNSVSNGGLAPDARYVNARVLDQFNSFSTGAWVRNGVGYAIEQDADILNLSLNFFAPTANGNGQLDLMLDWAVGQGVHVASCAGNIGQGNGYPNVRGPGSAYNAISVGRTSLNFERVHPDSAVAFTQDGRMKPDVVAPGTSITTLNDDWETQNDFTSVSGCSFATPHVAGLMAQQLDYGFANGLITDPLVVKATMANSAARVLDKSANLWEPAAFTEVNGLVSATQPLDTDSGTGQIDALALFQQYSAGQFVAGQVPDTGWALDQVNDQGQVQFDIQVPLPANASINVSLAWLRHAGRIDDGNGVVDAADTFFQSSDRDNLDLQILRNGDVIAESISSLDNLEHLKITTDLSGDYQIRVVGTSVVGQNDETFGLAWQVTDLPGDFNQDGSFACEDVDALVAAIVAGNHEPGLDLTGEGLVDVGDLAQWLATAGSINNSSGLGYLPADINLDGQVDGADFIQWNDNKFTNNAAWCDGDLNADGAIDGQDFILWNDWKFQSSQNVAVPEPSASWLIFCLPLLAHLRNRPSTFRTVTVQCIGCPINSAASFVAARTERPSQR